MSHLIYNTEAILLADLPRGEDNRLYFFFTRKLGLVAAQATGVRLLRSKLRFHLSLFSHVDIELVRGKNLWRLVGVYGRTNPIIMDNWPPFARISNLVQRMVHGEEINDALFETVVGARSMFSKPVSKAESDQIELVSVARILSSLGYLDTNKYSAVLDGDITDASLKSATEIKKNLIPDINRALKESHL